MIKRLFLSYFKPYLNTNMQFKKYCKYNKLCRIFERINAGIRNSFNISLIYFRTDQIVYVSFAGGQCNVLTKNLKEVMAGQTPSHVVSDIR